MAANEGDKPAVFFSASNQMALVESPSIQITSHHLNDDNFLCWAQSVKFFIRGKSKMGLLDGSRKPVLLGDAGYPIWDAENSMLMSWLVNSMEPEISQGYIFYSTAKDIWDAVNLTYSNQGNDSKLDELNEKARSVQQGDTTVTYYFNALHSLYQEIDLYQDAEWKDPEDHVMYKTLVEKDRVFKFLSGLPTEFDQERSRILGLQPIQSLREVFNAIKREESRINFMMGGPKTAQAEVSALVTEKQPPSNSDVASAHVSMQKSVSRKDDKDRLWCDHCQRSRHTRNTCWKLNGRPSNSGRGVGRGWNSPNGAGRGFQVAADSPKSVTTDSSPITKEQLEQFYRFMTQNLKPNTNQSSANLAQSGNFIQALSVSYNSSPWIVDSGATDHMTGSSKVFSSYIPCSGH